MIVDICNETQTSLNGCQIKVFSRPFLEYSPTYTHPHHQDPRTGENLSNVFELSFSYANALPYGFDWLKTAAFGHVITHNTSHSAPQNKLPNTGIIGLGDHIEYEKNSSVSHSRVNSSAMEWSYPDLWKDAGCLDFDQCGIFCSSMSTCAHWFTKDAVTPVSKSWDCEWLHHGYTYPHVVLSTPVLSGSEDPYWLEPNIVDSDLVTRTVAPDIALHILHRPFIEQRYPM
jgi:hypothetical protein